MNVTPLVDIVLVLLIIFMVVIPAMEKNAQVEVPSILNVDEGTRHRTDPFTLSLTSDGRMFFEEQSLDAETFEETLRAAHEQEDERKLVLRADRHAKWQDVRSLFAIVQEIGFPGIALRVNQRATEGGADGV